MSARGPQTVEYHWSCNVFQRSLKETIRFIVCCKTFEESQDGNEARKSET